MNISTSSGNFQVGDVITQLNSNANGTIIKVETTALTVVQTFGQFTVNSTDIISNAANSATAFVLGVSDRKIVDNSGDVIYIENTNNIDRSATTSEKIKLVIKF